MAQNKREYRCLIISPSDVSDERDALEEVVQNWNAHIGRGLGARVEAVRWERHSTPELGNRPQAIINQQIIEDCDLGVAIFWSRLGTPTSDFLSGSIEEIEILTKCGKNVFVYFSKRDIPQNNLDVNQLEKLRAVKEKYQKDGLIAHFSDIHNLKEQFLLHLTTWITKLLNSEKNFSASPENLLTAPKPDVRIEVNNAYLFHPNSDILIFYLSIEIQNHSPITVYTGNIYLKQNNGTFLFMPVDYLSHSTQLKEKLEAGESLMFSVDPLSLIEYRDTLTTVVFIDKINRIYEAESSTFLEKVNLVIDEYNKNGKNRGFKNIQPYLK